MQKPIEQISQNTYKLVTSEGVFYGHTEAECQRKAYAAERRAEIAREIQQSEIAQRDRQRGVSASRQGQEVIA